MEYRDNFFRNCCRNSRALASTFELQNWSIISFNDSGNFYSCNSNGIIRIFFERAMKNINKLS